MALLSSGNWNNSSNAGVWYANLLPHRITDQHLDCGNPLRPKDPREPLIRNSASSGPILSDERLSANCYDDVVSAITKLLRPKRPSAILRRVVAAVIDSLDRVIFGWWATHVGNKTRVIKPSLRNADSACAVVFEKRIRGVCATLNHRVPPPVHLGVSARAFAKSCSAHSNVIFFSEAAARLRAAVAKIGRLDIFGVAAFTQAAPCDSAAWSPFSGSNHKQFSKSTTNQINSCWHGFVQVSDRDNSNMQSALNQAPCRQRRLFNHAPD